jgi:hypothetical protein
MSEQAHNPELTALEARLTALAPAAPAIDRDYLFYHAGRTAARQGRGVWPYTTALMALVALGLGWVAVHRSQPLPPLEKTETRIVYVPMAKPDDSPVKPDRDSGQAPAMVLNQTKARTIEERMHDLKLRDQVLLMGIDALPNPQESTLPEKRAPLDPLLGMPATVLDEPGRNILKGLN